MAWSLIMSESVSNFTCFRQLSLQFIAHERDCWTGWDFTRTAFGQVAGNATAKLRVKLQDSIFIAVDNRDAYVVLLACL